MYSKNNDKDYSESSQNYKNSDDNYLYNAQKFSILEYQNIIQKNLNLNKNQENLVKSNSLENFDNNESNYYRHDERRHKISSSFKKFLNPASSYKILDNKNFQSNLKNFF